MGKAKKGIDEVGIIKDVTDILHTLNIDVKSVAVTIGSATLPNVFTASHSSPSRPNDCIWVCWGDYQYWTLEVIRYAIRTLYEYESAGELWYNSENKQCFCYADGIDFDKVGDFMGVDKSGPSVLSPLIRIG